MHTFKIPGKERQEAEQHRCNKILTPPQGRRMAKTQISHTSKYVAQQRKRGRAEGENLHGVGAGPIVDEGEGEMGVCQERKGRRLTGCAMFLHACFLAHTLRCRGNSAIRVAMGTRKAAVEEVRSVEGEAEAARARAAPQPQPPPRARAVTVSPMNCSDSWSQPRRPR